MSEESLLNDILNELKWHSKQNDKIMELLGKLRQPCGQGQTEMLNMLKGLMPKEAMKDPRMVNFMNQAEEIIKKEDR